MIVLFTLLAVQICLGAFDSIWHHEITERLPSRRSARHELALHGAREVLYAAVFLGIAWYEWRGLWAWALAGLLMVEIIITLADFVLEDRTRKLPALERIVHTVLALNFGVFLALLWPVWVGWAEDVTLLAPVSYGGWSWFFTVCALGVTGSAIRNLSAAIRFALPPHWRRAPIRAGVSTTPRTVLVTGATGFIGRHLCRTLIESGHELIVSSRDGDRAWDLYGPHARIVSSLESIESNATIDAVVNLAGAPILAQWWTTARRRELMNSRQHVTSAIVELIARLERKPEVLVSMSAVGYYGVRGDEDVTEADRGRPIFQSHLCQVWELAALRAQQFGVRVCRLRAGLVLGADGGALPRLLASARLGAQIVLGSGRQWVSWIHIDDLLRLITSCIERPDMRGAFNACAPYPVRQREFARSSAAHFGRSIRLKVPRALLRACLGEMSQLLLDGQKVLPAAALLCDFQFHYPRYTDALRQLIPRPGSVEPAPARIFYDPNCPVCDAEMSRYCEDAQRAGYSWRFENVAEREDVMAQYRIDTRAARQRVYVIDSEGQISSGIEALAKIWTRLPQWRWLARSVRLPVLSSIAALAYDLLIAPTIWRWSERRATKASHRSRMSLPS